MDELAPMCVQCDGGALPLVGAVGGDSPDAAVDDVEPPDAVVVEEEPLVAAVATAVPPPISVPVSATPASVCRSFNFGVPSVVETPSAVTDRRGDCPLCVPRTLGVRNPDVGLIHHCALRA